jgi:hypothetical protein
MTRANEGGYSRCRRGNSCCDLARQSARYRPRHDYLRTASPSSQ